MRCIFPLVFALVVALHSNAVVASDGNQLLQDCGDVVRVMDGGNYTSSAVGMGYCLGLMQGIISTNGFYQVTAPGKDVVV